MQREFVTVCSESEQAALGDVAEIAVVPELFAAERNTQVYFNKRYADCEQSVSERNARVCECAGVQEDEVDVLIERLLHAVNQRMFSVALEAAERVAEFGGQSCQAGFDVRQSGGAIDFGLARAEQVQIRSVDKQKCRHASLNVASLPKMAAILNLFAQISANFARFNGPSCAAGAGLTMTVSAIGMIWSTGKCAPGELHRGRSLTPLIHEYLDFHPYL